MLNNINNLVPFVKNGLELFIATNSGESFASQSAVARMCEVSEAAIRKWITSNQISVIITEINTATGLKTSHLLSESSILEALAKYKPNLLKTFAQAGLRVYLHKLAGYEVTSSIAKPDPDPMLLDCLQLIANLERRIASREREYDRLGFLLTVGQGEHRFAESQRSDVEKRLTEVERQLHLATLERIGFPDPTVEVAELTTRFSLVEHVRGYAEQYQQSIPDCWTLLHNAFRNRYHVDLVARGKNCRPTKTGCEYAEASGQIEELYAIARKFLR